MLSIFRCSIPAAVVVVLANCGTPPSSQSRATPSTRRSTAANVTSGCLDRYAESIDYFPHKTVIESAQNFSVEYRNSYKVVTVSHAYVGGPPERYVLVQCGTPTPRLPADLASAPLVPVPVTSIFSASTTHLQVLADLNRIEVVTGVSKAADATIPSLVSRIASGAAVEFAPTSVIDTERVVARAPSIFMTGGSFHSALAVVRGAGIPVVANVEWLESTPLARSEWVKYTALFLNEEQKAQATFDRVKHAYASLVERTRTIPDDQRPSVMTGRATRGTYFSAGGKSYVAELIADAGGRYIWQDNAATGTVAFDLEAQLQRAANADIWINGGGWRDRATMLEDEPRYALLKAYRQGEIWVYERRATAAGGNDYWSRSITRPDLVLADLVKIFHPRLLPDHQFEWYMRVPVK
jgi:iron complex transport system substrate-binding protein